MIALAASALVALGIIAGLLFAHRRGHLLAAALPTLLLLAFASVLAKIALDTDYRDADGWVDCFPSCSPLQRAVGYSLVLAPAVGVLIVVFVVAARVIDRRNARQGRSRRFG